MVKLTDEYEAYIDPIIGEYFDEYKFYMEFDSEWLTSNLPADTELEDLWKLNVNVDYPLPDISIYLPPQGEVNIKPLMEKLSEKNFKGSVGIKVYGLQNVMT